MFSKLFCILLVVLATLLTTGCVAHQPQLPTGVIGQTNPGEVILLEGRSGTDVMSALQFRVPQYCAGRVINLRTDFRTENIRGGRQSYHGVHVDYELRADNQTTWAPDWREDPSFDWQTVQRSWGMPVTMRSATVRIGLQGVVGQMYVRNVYITC